MNDFGIPDPHDDLIAAWKTAVTLKYPKAKRWMVFKNGTYQKRRYVPARGPGKKRKMLIDRLTKRQVLAEIAFYKDIANG